MVKGGCSETSLGGRFNVIRDMEVRVRHTTEQVDADRIDVRVLDDQWCFLSWCFFLNKKILYY